VSDQNGDALAGGIRELCGRGGVCLRRAGKHQAWSMSGKEKMNDFSWKIYHKKKKSLVLKSVSLVLI
jgi:hypothetical protein